jgi:hypothetical protein
MSKQNVQEADSSPNGSSGVAALSATSQSASAATSASVQKVMPVVGRKGAAMHYLSGNTKPCRFVEKVDGGAWICFFFAHLDEAAQHTSVSDISWCSSTECAQPTPTLPEPDETPFNQGQKVWALKNGGGYERGRVIHVFGAHQTALVMFFDPTGRPSQNTKWSNISLTKPA